MYLVRDYRKESQMAVPLAGMTSIQTGNTFTMLFGQYLGGTANLQSMAFAPPAGEHKHTTYDKKPYDTVDIKGRIRPIVIPLKSEPMV